MKTRDALKWKIISNIVMAFFAFTAILPFYLLVVSSLTKEAWVTAHGYSFFPKEFSISAYEYLLTQITVFGRGYLNTILVTGVGTIGSVLLTSMFAYVLSNDKLPGVGIMNFLCVFTMLFSGGQVASYYIWGNVFHIRDTIWALILPNLLMNAFSIIIVKNYYLTSIPEALKEAARIDGLSEFKIFLKIVMPLSIPINATIGLMSGLAYWNDWINGLYFLTQRNGEKFYTIQLILNQINENISWISQSASSSMGTSFSSFPTTTARMAIAVIGMIPILIIYPFMQKYFVKGITIGAVKE